MVYQERAITYNFSVSYNIQKARYTGAVKRSLRALMIWYTRFRSAYQEIYVSMLLEEPVNPIVSCVCSLVVCLYFLFNR